MVGIRRQDWWWPLLAVVLFAAAVACNKNATGPTDTAFTLEARYNAIRTYPNGGGIFIVSALTREGPGSNLSWTIEADPTLNAAITSPAWNDGCWVAEITIRPVRTIALGIHPIKVVVSRGETSRELILSADVLDWQVDSVSEEASGKKAIFLAWLEAQHPEIGSLRPPWFAYVTYPEVLVVEHWTFLSPEWEMRICSHVMIPPHDWSMMWLRHRGERDPRLTAKRESDGTIHLIPVDEYPILFGY